MQCQRCNERLPLSARVCFSCGAPVLRDTAEDPPSERPAVPAQMRVAAESVSMRDRPFASARPVLVLYQGAIVTIVAEQWGFAQAETADGRRGFVERSALEPATAPRPAPPAPRKKAAAAVRQNGAINGAVSVIAPPVQPPASADVESISPEPVEPPPAEPQPATPAAAPLESAAPQRLAGTPQHPAGALPFNIPYLFGERVRYRAVFLYNPLEDQALVVTNRRVIVTGGTFGSLPRVLLLDEIDTVRLQDTGSGSTNGEGNLHITLIGGAVHVRVGGVHIPHHVRDEILAACAEIRGDPKPAPRTVNGARRAKPAHVPEQPRATKAR